MPRYSTSRLRLAFLIAMIGAIIFVFASPGAAQTPPDTSAPPAVGHTLFSLVMANKDAIFYTILILSITSLTLMLQGFLAARESAFMPVRTTEMIREMISQRRFQELIDFTETDNSFISKSLNPALKRAPSFNAMKDAMETALGEQTAEQFRKIEYLNIIGNLGPLLGLLGTVIGMIDAFLAYTASNGDAPPAVLAFGISKALVHTMLGLILAVPCLAAFGVLRTMIDRLTVRGALLAEELLLMIKPSEARPAAAAAIAAQRPSAVPPSIAPPLMSARP